MPDNAFAGLNVVVTGGSGGLGRAIVAQFAAAGARVASADLNPAGVPGAAFEQRLDVTDEDSWIALMDRVQAELGTIDVLVNNAGIYRPNIAFEDMELATWREHLAINADGVFLGCKHAIRHMKARADGRTGGAIVNMGSGMSIKANPTGAAYCASKAAVLMTTRTAAGAAGRYGIRVNAVLPGAVPTEMLMGNMVSGQTEDDFLAAMEAYSPLRRLATPDDIARAVLFLADPANAAVSGIFVPVDGGNMPGA